MEEKISIIIPYHNGEAYIEETLNSVYEQTYSNIEVIIVNDGSESTFLDTLIAKQYSKVKLFCQENQGQSSARNNGAKHATGKYLVFLDCDDKIHPKFLEKTLNILQKDKNIRLCYTRGRYFEKTDKEWILHDFTVKEFLIENCIPITTLIYKEDFDEIGGFDTKLTYYEDWDFWISIIEKGGIPYKIDEILFYYRIRNTSNSLTNTHIDNLSKLSDNFFEIYKKHYHFYKQNHLGFHEIMTLIRDNKKYKTKYYNEWYRKLIYKIFKPKKFKKIYNFP